MQDQGRAESISSFQHLLPLGTHTRVVAGTLKGQLSTPCFRPQPGVAVKCTRMRHPPSSMPHFTPINFQGTKHRLHCN